MAQYSTDDLVLRVKSDYDPSLLRLHKYEAFLDALCEDREYQKEAIRTVCRFLAGGEYESAAALAAENYASNDVLVERYGSLEHMIEALPLADKLSCAVDLATGTGKSWVMYGVARILLAEGIVDRVLVLCPSLTIEAGLKEKFQRFSGDARLRDLIPADATFRNPEITDANVTTTAGQICVENIDATYKHVRSSVRDSFVGRGETTLVLNDETHHVFSPPTGQRAIRRWLEFLENPEFGFKRVVGFSGTCYIGNDYFPNVVARYSLRRAMEEGRVKEVRYVAKDESLSQEERFQKYLQLHNENIVRYPSLKPLSIIVTGTIDAAGTLAGEFTRFLASELKIPRKDAETQVIVVTSHKDHQKGVARLPYADRRDDPTEWIVSVSMLTEGWDVQNVFQVVPHEKRAFQSKLLIAQVLGRGLRVPKGLSRPAVRVFNHSSWSSEISGLVAEVLDQERRLHAYPVDGRTDTHFDLHQIEYKTRTVEQELTPKNGDGQVDLFKRGYVKFEVQPEELERQTVFESALDSSEHVLKTKVHFTSHSVDEVVKRLRARLKSIDIDGGTAYARSFPPKNLKEIVEESLKQIGETRGVVTEQNLQHAYRAMGNTQRKTAKMVRIELEPDSMHVVSTRSIRGRSVALTSFRKEATVFFDSASADLSEDVDKRALDELIADDSPYPRQAAKEVPNKFNFKTPVNVVLTTHRPERTFVARLFEPDVAAVIASWVKSPDVGFYEIAYSWRKGDHTKQGKFNPDFFIKLADSKDILVVELKDDGDDSDENRAKLKYALEHFARVNSLQSDAAYHMLFLSPESYDAFFQELRAGRGAGYMSALQAALEED